MTTKKITRGQFLGTSLGLSAISLSKLHGSNSSLFNVMEGSQDSFIMNEQIRTAREVALKILKPSKKQLEHGLELHRNSLVIETYGFMPRAAIDADVINAAIEDRASNLELQDLREDMSMTRFAENEREREEFKNAWKAAGVTCVFQNAGEESNSIPVLLKRLARFTYATDMMKDVVQKAVTPDEIVQAKRENRHALYFSGNGVPLPQDSVSPEEELRYIRVFFQLGIRIDRKSVV